MGVGAAPCMAACPACPPVQDSPVRGDSDCAAALGCSVYCQGTEKEATSRGSSANLPFKSPYGLPSSLHYLQRRPWRGKLLERVTGRQEHPAGTRSCAESGNLCSALKVPRAAGPQQRRKKSVCLILKLLPMSNFHGHQISVLDTLQPR